MLLWIAHGDAGLVSLLTDLKQAHFQQGSSYEISWTIASPHADGVAVYLINPNCTCCGTEVLCIFRLAPLSLSHSLMNVHRFFPGTAAAFRGKVFLCYLLLVGHHWRGRAVYCLYHSHAISWERPVHPDGVSSIFHSCW